MLCFFIHPVYYESSIPVKKTNVRYPNCMWPDSYFIHAIEVCFIPTQPLIFPILR